MDIASERESTSAFDNAKADERCRLSEIERFGVLFNAFFGFKEKPFRNTPDPHFFFMSHNHRSALMHMLFGVQERRGFIVLTGEIGSGKTTVCRQFLSQLGQEVKTAVILNPNLSSLDLMAAIVKDFGIKPSGINKKDYFDDLNTTLLEWAHRGQNACLVIDESQCLSTRVLEEIRLLTNLETAKQKLLQIVLIGQPELRDIIRRPELTQLRQRIGVSFHLSGLNPQETKDYVYHRLQCVQEKKMELHFTESVLESIYLTTRGIPRLINSLCDRILMSAYAKGTQQIDWEIAQPAVEEIAFICA